MKTGHEIVREHLITENRELWMDLDPTGDLGEDIKRLYEANYKYDMVSQAISREGGVGPTVKRFRNIKERLASRAWSLIDVVAPEFESTFRRWLELHDLESAENWAEAHLDEPYVSDLLRSARGADGYQRLWDGITQIGGGRRTGSGPSIFRVLKDWASIGDQFQDYIKRVVSEEMDRFEQGSERFEEMMELYQSNDYVEMYDQIVEPILDSITAGDPGRTIEHIMSAGMQSLDLEEFIKYTLTDHVYPYWLDKWSGEVTQIVDNVEEMADELSSIKRKSLSQAFITINRAIGTTHSNGSMMEYVQEYNPTVDLMLLDELTDGEFTDQWDQELQDARIPV